MAISPSEFSYVSDLARRSAAIVIDPGKEYFIESRLAPLVHSHGCKTLGELIAQMQKTPSFSALHGKVIDALTTNETFFFRDFAPFEALRKTIIPQPLKVAAPETDWRRAKAMSPSVAVIATTAAKPRARRWATVRVFMTAFGGLAKRRTNTHAAHWSHQAAMRPRA
ncbi:MAG: hypothetical protein RL324_1721 [Verrucomicrobiota bacterium]|jgi:hypothetical protein